MEGLDDWMPLQAARQRDPRLRASSTSDALGLGSMGWAAETLHYETADGLQVRLDVLYCSSTGSDGHVFFRTPPWGFCTPPKFFFCARVENRGGPARSPREGRSPPDDVCAVHVSFSRRRVCFAHAAKNLSVSRVEDRGGARDHRRSPPDDRRPRRRYRSWRGCWRPAR